MRKNRMYGSEDGEVTLPDPYSSLLMHATIPGTTVNTDDWAGYLVSLSVVGDVASCLLSQTKPTLFAP